MDDLVAQGRFRAALDLAETGVALMRQNLRRRHPDATEDEIDTLVLCWQARLSAQPAAGAS